jgi:ECF sigma factor
MEKVAYNSTIPTMHPGGSGEPDRGDVTRKAQAVELRFFGGLSVDETAEVLHVSAITVMREWRTAKAWLYRELTGRTGNGSRTLEPGR